MRPVLRVAVGAVALTSAATVCGLSANALRSDRLPLVAPFPFEHQCADKLDTRNANVIGVQALAKRLRRESIVLLDARPAEDFAQQHLAGARSQPLSMTNPIDQAAVAPWQHTPVVVYCDSPDDAIAHLKAQQLRDAGLRQVLVLAGGLDTARRHGLATLP